VLVNEAADGVDLVVNNHEKVLLNLLLTISHRVAMDVTRCPFPKPSTALHVEVPGGDLDAEFVEETRHSNTFLVLWPLTSS
jgi:hypothetical protein